MFERTVPSSARWRWEDLPGGVRVTIPVPTRWAIVIFSGLWLAFWGVAEGAAIGGLLSEEKAGGWHLFSAIWLLGWSIGGVAVLCSLLWQLGGETVIEVGQGRLRLRRGVGPIRWGRVYDAGKIKNLRASTLDRGVSNWLASRDYSWLGRGIVAFDYGDRACVFRLGLEPSEATNLVNRLSRHLG
jgi:hypothetical protein